MEPLSIAALGLSAYGAVSSYFGKQEQAARIRAQTDEQLRRLRMGQEQQLGQATAAGAASGIEFESASLQNHLGAMSAEFQRQRDWLSKTGAQQADDISAAGGNALLGDLGGSLFSFGQANNWWKVAP